MYRPDFHLLTDRLDLDLSSLALIAELRTKLDATPALPVWSDADFALDRWALAAPHDGAALAPRPGTFADVSNALLATPVVKDLLSRVDAEARTKLGALEREWSAATTPEKAGIVAVGALVGGGALAAVFAAEPARRMAFGLLKGKDLPVPGVDGLSIKLLDAGAAVTMPTVVPGMTITVHAAGLDGARPDYGLFVSLDLTKLFKKR